jgi:hypothetical protein
MASFVSISNTTVSEQSETAGACGGFLLGAATGARIASAFWWLGPVATPVVIMTGIVVGGTVGAVGGSNLGEVIASKL